MASDCQSPNVAGSARLLLLPVRVARERAVVFALGLFFATVSWAADPRPSAGTELRTTGDGQAERTNGVPHPLAIKRWELPIAFTRIAPASIDELRQFERHTEGLIQRVS